MLKTGISPASDGRERTDVIGIHTFVKVLLVVVVGISPASNGRERMDFPGTIRLVQLHLGVGTSPSSDGRERTDVPGINIGAAQLILAVAPCRKCSSMLLLKVVQANERLR